jgi:hypothetical protein
MPLGYPSIPAAASPYVHNLTVPLSEFERSLIAERVKAGMQRAKVQGKHTGRPALPCPPSPVLEADQLTRVARRGTGVWFGRAACSVVKGRTHHFGRTTCDRTLWEERSIMRTLLVSALALGALTSAALAEEPVVLTDAQMDAVSAGGIRVRSGDAIAVSAAVIVLDVDGSVTITGGTLSATSAAATATSGAANCNTCTSTSTTPPPA